MRINKDSLKARAKYAVNLTFEEVISNVTQWINKTIDNE